MLAGTVAAQNVWLLGGIQVCDSFSQCSVSYWSVVYLGVELKEGRQRVSYPNRSYISFTIYFYCFIYLWCDVFDHSS